MLLKSMDTLDQSSCYLRLLKKKKTVFFTLHITIIYSLSKECILLKNLISRGFLTEKNKHTYAWEKCFGRLHFVVVVAFGGFLFNSTFLPFLLGIRFKKKNM